MALPVLIVPSQRILTLRSPFNLPWSLHTLPSNEGTKPLSHNLALILAQIRKDMLLSVESKFTRNLEIFPEINKILIQILKKINTKGIQEKG